MNDILNNENENNINENNIMIIKNRLNLVENKIEKIENYLKENKDNLDTIKEKYYKNKISKINKSKHQILYEIFKDISTEANKNKLFDKVIYMFPGMNEKQKIELGKLVLNKK